MKASLIRVFLGKALSKSFTVNVNEINTIGDQQYSDLMNLWKVDSTLTDKNLIIVQVSATTSSYKHLKINNCFSYLTNCIDPEYNFYIKPKELIENLGLVTSLQASSICFIKIDKLAK
ncbi:hypothetical protein GLOIN_2v1785571 [Rhizophagus clarus]|uniref:Uncharacterized protein n=1 Tax=Rhizophagus clarus TaxID=94130 RepID=A0A8H3LGY2_9GLOM|nr:hypothetical protein GLOIN_2v1785571 [Rhizophagus clarus]